MTDINISTSEKSPVPLVDLLGPKIVKNTGDEISVAELARTKQTIVLYFSAHWCPPCRGFTPALSEAYAKYKESRVGGDDFELVFVSSDRDATSFREYHLEMTFPALPYEARDVKAELSEKFRVDGIPHMVAVDASTGEASPVNEAAGDLRSFITKHGAAAFPLTPSHVEKMKAEAGQEKADALRKLAASSISISLPSSLITSDKTEGNAAEKKTTMKLGDLLEQHEYVGLVFGDGDNADAAYGKIQDTAKTLGSEKFVPVYVGWTEYGDQSDHSALWDRFYSIREDELTDDARSVLGSVAGESVDCLTMVTIKSGVSGLCGLDGKCDPGGVPVVASVDKGVRALSQFGPLAFPWDKAAVKNALQVKERRVSDLKERLAGFDFLRAQPADIGSRSLLIKGTSNKKGSDKDPKEVKYASMGDLLASNDGDEDDSAVLGLYFSAHWCPPCRSFTPELLKKYEEVRATKGANSFEVVFVSFDNDEKEFNEYYYSMVTPNTKDQWLSLEYTESRELVSDLTEVFGVRGFPSLVLLKRDGTILSNNARGSVSEYGAVSFPWDAESIQRAEAELLKQEEEAVEAQCKQGDGVVVRRIVGPIGSIKYDAAERALDFKNTFSSSVIDEIAVTQGVLYYEAEILATNPGHHLAQFGFSLRGAFQQMNGGTGVGIGDNSSSWGVCGFRQELWHDEESVPVDCVWEMGDVIGFAVNVDAGKIAISKKGNWSKEAGCGVVFNIGSLSEAVGGAGGIHPGLTGSGLKVRLNMQEKDFRFSKPSDEVWLSIGDDLSEDGSAQ